MAQYLEITCITRDDRLERHARITHIGGLHADRRRWKLAQSQAIDGIDAGTWMFYVIAGGRFVWVDVAADECGQKYLRAETDGNHPETLLSLPDCPT